MLRYLIELYNCRELLFRLVSKEVRVRYKSAILGWLWSLIVPLSVSLIFFVIFTYLAPIPKGQFPFFLFLVVAMFPWMFFAGSVSLATMSVLESGALIKKNRFPRALIPLSVVSSQFVNFILALVVVMAIAVAAGVRPTGWIFLLPVVIVLELVLTCGVVLLVSGLQVHYRDVKYLVEIGLLLGFYLTPIFYPVDLLGQMPAAVRVLYFANPMVHVVELFRLSLLGGSSGLAVLSPLMALGAATVAAFASVFVGLSVFRRYESTFADWVLG